MSNPGEEVSLPQSELTGGQLLTRLLELITGGTSLADFNADQVGRVVGVPTREDERGFRYVARLTPDWKFLLRRNENARLGTAFVLQFFNNEGTSSGPMTDICQLDFDQFATGLEQAGFASETSYGEQGQVINHRFTRPPLVVTIAVRGESGEPGKVGHDCITSVKVA